MNTARFSRVAFWPTNSARVCGRSEASAASSSRRTGETVRSARRSVRAAPFCASSFRLSRITASSAAVVAQPFDRARDRRLRLRPAVAEIDQRRQRVLGHARGRTGCGMAKPGADGIAPALSRNSVSRRAASRAPTPGARVRLAGRRRRWRRSDRAATAPTGSTAPPRPPTPCTVVSRRNQSRSAVSAKPIQLDRVLAHMRLHQQPRRLGRPRQRGERAGSRRAPDSRRRSRR